MALCVCVFVRVSLSLFVCLHPHTHSETICEYDRKTLYDSQVHSFHHKQFAHRKSGKMVQHIWWYYSHKQALKPGLCDQSWELFTVESELTVEKKKIGAKVKQQKYWGVWTEGLEHQLHSPGYNADITFLNSVSFKVLMGLKGQSHSYLEQARTGMSYQ